MDCYRHLLATDDPASPLQLPDCWEQIPASGAGSSSAGAPASNCHEDMTNFAFEFSFEEHKPFSNTTCAHCQCCILSECISCKASNHLAVQDRACHCSRSEISGQHCVLELRLMHDKGDLQAEGGRLLIILFNSTNFSNSDFMPSTGGFKRDLTSSFGISYFSTRMLSKPQKCSRLMWRSSLWRLK